MTDPVDAAQLAKALRLALYALNEAPVFQVRLTPYRDSQEVAAALEAVLRRWDLAEAGPVLLRPNRRGMGDGHSS